MGYISTLISQDNGSSLPQWFIDKYSNNFFIDGALVATKRGLKLYDSEFENDYQKALIENGYFEHLKSQQLVVISEDGFVTKVVITKEDIEYIWFTDDNGRYEDNIWIL